MNSLLKTLFIAAISGTISFPLIAQNFNLQLRSLIHLPGQSVASVCGWTSPDGHEYALIGASKGLVITDITNPDVPVQIVQIPGTNFDAREIKTYSHYAYITNSTDGIQIVDLSGLPNANLAYHNYTGDNNIPPLNYVHTLHIDVTKGYLYTYGGNESNDAVVHNLNNDPYHPVYAGVFNDLGVIHDGYVENDTLYACHILMGIMSVVDMSDKTTPVILGTVETPGKFPHNSWLLDDQIGRAHV